MFCFIFLPLLLGWVIYGLSVLPVDKTTVLRFFAHFHKIAEFRLLATLAIERKGTHLVIIFSDTFIQNKYEGYLVSKFHFVYHVLIHDNCSLFIIYV